MSIPITAENMGMFVNPISIVDTWNRWSKDKTIVVRPWMITHAIRIYFSIFNSFTLPYPYWKLNLSFAIVIMHVGSKA